MIGRHMAALCWLTATAVVLILVFAGIAPPSTQAQTLEVTRPALGITDEPAACEEILINGSFEEEDLGWTQYSEPPGIDLIDTFNPRTGVYGGWMGGIDNVEHSLTQSITLPSDGRHLRLSYWWSLFTQEQNGSSDDTMRVQLLRADNTVLRTITTHICGQGSPYVWYEASADLSSYAGQPLKLRFLVETDNNKPTSFYLDDVSIQACPSGIGLPTDTPTPTPTNSPSPTPTNVTASSATPTATATPAARVYVPMIARR